MSEQNAGAAPVETAVSPESESSVSESTSSQEQSQAASGEAVQALQEKAENGSPKERAAAKKALKSLKIKVDGKEYDEALPFEIDENDEATKEWLTKNLQLSKVSQKRMQEQSQLRKEAEEFINLLKKDPRRVLSDPNIGVDLKKFASDIINEELENAQKSPEQREKEKLQKELEELKASHKREQEEKERLEFERLQAETEQKLDEEITSVLNTGGLPKSPYVVKRMAAMMSLALENGIDLSAKDVFPIVKKEIESEIKEMFGAAPEEVMEQLLGKDNISRLRKRSIAKAKQSQVAETASGIKSTGADVKKKEAEAPKKINIKDFLKM